MEVRGGLLEEEDWRREMGRGGAAHLHRLGFPAAAAQRLEKGKTKLGLGFLDHGILYHKALPVGFPGPWAGLKIQMRPKLFNRFVQIPGPNEMAEFRTFFVFSGRNPKHRYRLLSLENMK